MDENKKKKDKPVLKKSINSIGENDKPKSDPPCIPGLNKKKQK